jgi:hypothetical protein
MADEKLEEAVATPTTALAPKLFRPKDDAILVASGVASAFIITFALRVMVDATQLLSIRALSVAFLGIVVGLFGIYVKKINTKLTKFVKVNPPKVVDTTKLKVINTKTPPEVSKIPSEDVKVPKIALIPKRPDPKINLSADKTPYARNTEALEQMAAVELNRQEVVQIVINTVGVEEYNKSVWNNYSFACRIYERIEKNGLQNFNQEELKKMAVGVFGTDLAETGWNDGDLGTLFDSITAFEVQKQLTK